MRKVGAGLLWGGVSLVFIGLATLSVSAQTHLVYSAAVVLVMAAMKMAGVNGPWRLVFIGLGASIVLRYAYWRTMNTLPPVDDVINFIPAIVLYIAEMYGILMLGLNLFVMAYPPRPRICPDVAPDDLPTVDVFVPTYNEDPAMLATTLAAAKSMHYPADKLTIWLLDDGGTDQKINSPDADAASAASRRRAQLSRMCEEFGARYLTRERNVHAKAGNMNNALAHATGDLIAVFDADHAPVRTFLSETAGFFTADPRLFLVQTPHFFINPDPVEHNLGTFYRMPSENELFNGLILQSFDKWNAVFFCGSAAVLRREAIDEIGGFRHNSITEDCETALALHSRGWSSAYVGKALIAGLQPETYANFIGQRSRWAQGMMQIMLFNFPLLERGLSLPQRLCYMSSLLYWFFPFPRLLFLFAPLLFLLFNMKVFVVSGDELVAYVGTYLAANLLLNNYLYGNYRWPWISELYEFVQSVYLFRAILSVLANPRKPSFKVTAKNQVLEEERISEIGLPLFIIFGVLLAILVIMMWRLFERPDMAAFILAVGFWNVCNLFIAGCALGVVSERRNRRHSHRIDIARRCELTTAANESFTGSIDDVSLGGVGLRLVNADILSLPKGQAVSMTFRQCDGSTSVPVPLLVHRRSQAGQTALVGCQFTKVDDAAVSLAVADLAFSDARQWQKFQESRRGNIGLIRGTARFARIAALQTVRGLSFLFSSFRTADDRPETRR